MEFKQSLWLSPAGLPNRPIFFTFTSKYCYLAADEFCLSAVFYFFEFFQEVLNISKKKELQINNEISDKEVRVVGDDGAQLGIMSSREALKLAEQKGLDLVKISPQANPPVCKIIDYGKYRFEQNKRAKEAKKNQHIVEVKEIRLSLSIDSHDLNTKLKHASKFISAGDKVKVTIRFRGREMGHPEAGYEVMNKFAEACEEFATIEKKAKLEGRNMIMFLAPKSKNMTKSQKS